MTLTRRPRLNLLLAGTHGDGVAALDLTSAASACAISAPAIGSNVTSNVTSNGCRRGRRDSRLTEIAHLQWQPYAAPADRRGGSRSTPLPRSLARPRGSPTTRRAASTARRSFPLRRESPAAAPPDR